MADSHPAHSSCVRYGSLLRVSRLQREAACCPISGTDQKEGLQRRLRHVGLYRREAVPTVSVRPVPGGLEPFRSFKKSPSGQNSRWYWLSRRCHQLCANARSRGYSALGGQADRRDRFCSLAFKANTTRLPNALSLPHVVD